LTFVDELVVEFELINPTIRYFAGAALTVPLLPVLYLQAKRLRTWVPVLPAADGPAGQHGDPASSPLRIVVLGESTMAGLGAATHAEAFAGTLARQLADALVRRIDWRVLAESGYTARQVTAELVPQVANDAVDLFVVGLGGNDTFELRSPARWRRDVLALINALRHSHGDVPVVFLSVPPVYAFPAFTRLMQFTLGGLVHILADETSTVAASNDNVWFDERRISLDGWVTDYHPEATVDDCFSDGVHPSQLTYRIWGEIASKYIVNNLGQRLRTVSSAGQ